MSESVKQDQIKQKMKKSGRGTRNYQNHGLWPGSHHEKLYKALSYFNQSDRAPPPLLYVDDRKLTNTEQIRHFPFTDGINILSKGQQEPLACDAKWGI